MATARKTKAKAAQDVPPVPIALQRFVEVRVQIGPVSCVDTMTLEAFEKARQVDNVVATRAAEAALAAYREVSSDPPRVARWIDKQREDAVAA